MGEQPGESASGDRASALGAWLRRRREAAGLTQEELAERAGLSSNAIGALEQGKRRRPYPHTIRALAAALGLSSAQLAELTRLARHAQPPATAADTTVTGAELPGPVTPLVGREDDVAAVEAALARARLVTITGPGGVGKTRLAASVARSIAAQAPGSVVWLSLATTSDPGRVLPAIAQATHTPEVPGQPLQQAVQRALATRQLLVLDNFEHLLAAAAEVAALLAACESLTVLVTSRTPLRLRGEQEYPLAPLATPTLERIPSAEEAMTSPAVRLFVVRAREVLPAFDLNDANAPAVSAICRRVDGLPLAVELAASRIRVLTPTALLARLDRALPLLTGGARDLPARQQTLRDTIAWSYELLRPDEQALFRRLSVFASGLTLEAAEWVSGAGSWQAGPGSDVLDLIDALAAKSLLRREPYESNEPRFTMLETIQEFAGERLLASGEADTAHRAHADFFIAQAEEAEPHFPGPVPEPWLALLDREYDNLRAAFAWLAASGDWAGLLRLASALWFYWFSRSSIAEGRRWLASGLAAHPDAPAEIRVKATIGAGWLAMAQGDFDDAASLLQRGESLAGPADHRAIGLAHFGLGVVAQDQGRPEPARQRFASALDAFRAAGDQVMIATTLNNLGLVTARGGDDEQGIALLASALAIHEALGYALGMALSQRFLGQIALRRGDTPHAARHFRDSLDLDWSHAQRWHVANAMESLAGIAATTGRLTQAVQVLAAAAALRTTAGAPLEPALQQEQARLISRLEAQLGPAFATAWSEGTALPLPAAIAEARSIADA